MSTQSAPVYDGPPPDDAVTVETGDVGMLLDGAGALTAVDKAAIDVQIATAKQYPRRVSDALKEAMTLATLDEDTAASMSYALPRGKNDDGSKKFIEGPSARLAEVMVYSWGNMRVDADIVAEDKTTVTAMGTCFDLEKNIAVRVRVKRRITDSRGRRYNDDMIAVTANAAISIALRNCTFKVIPRALTDRIWHGAQRASLGEGQTMAQKRQNALATCARLGVKPEEVFALLGVGGIDDIGEEQLITLRGVLNAIKEGEISVANAFRSTDRTASSERTAELNQAIGAKKAPSAAGGPAT